MNFEKLKRKTHRFSFSFFILSLYAGVFVVYELSRVYGRNGFMAKIWCCRRFQHAEVFKIAPTKKDVLEEFVLYNQCCSCCKQPVLEILRADVDENILKPVRLNSKNIQDFIKKMDVLWKPRKFAFPKSKISKFILNYNEFGKINKCSKNLSGLTIGRVETDPVINLKSYKAHQQIGNLKISL